jgi:hypothetical protein
MPLPTVKRQPAAGEKVCPHCSGTFNVRGYGRHEKACLSRLRDSDLPLPLSLEDTRSGGKFTYSSVTPDTGVLIILILVFTEDVQSPASSFEDNNETGTYSSSLDCTNTTIYL